MAKKLHSPGCLSRRRCLVSLRTAKLLRPHMGIQDGVLHLNRLGAACGGNALRCFASTEPLVCFMLGSLHDSAVLVLVLTVRSWFCSADPQNSVTPPSLHLMDCRKANQPRNVFQCMHQACLRFTATIGAKFSAITAPFCGFSPRFFGAGEAFPLLMRKRRVIDDFQLWSEWCNDGFRHLLITDDDRNA